MKVIWKYELPAESGAAEVEMPRSAEVLSVHVHRGFPMIYAKCDVGDVAKSKRKFYLAATGEYIRPTGNWRFIGTVATRDGACFMLHVFEIF
jgi:hypothetical protein